MYISSKLYNLESLINRPCDVFETRGIQDGNIIKFNQYYIKMYPDNKNSIYRMEYYRYNNDIPFLVDHVHISNISRYLRNL